MENRISIKVWIGVAFFFFGMVFLIIGLPPLRDSFRSKNWLKANGEVIESRIVSKTYSGKRKMKERYSPSVYYKYAVDNKIYYSDQISFGATSYNTVFKSSSDRSREWVEKYPAGSKVYVFYDSKNHSKSVLLNGVKLDVFIKPIIGLVMCCVGYFIGKGARDRSVWKV